MGRPTIEQIRSLQDFATLYQWEVKAARTPSAVATPSDDAINFRAATSSLPKATNQPIEINVRGHKIKQPGITNYDNQWTLVLYETVDSIVSRWIENWRQCCWNIRTGYQETRKDSEGDFIVTRLNRQNEPIYQLKLIGCWLEDFDWGGELGDSTSEAIRPSMTISYDYWEATAL